MGELHTHDTARRRPRGRGLGRVLGVLVLAGGVMGPAGGASVHAAGRPLLRLQAPPDSLEPGVAAGRVRFEHRHRRVIACRARKQTTPECRAEREDASPTTSLTLKPIADPSVAGQDEREPVVVQLSADSGKAERWVELQAGVWELHWAEPTKTRRPRIRVSEADRFDVRLRTESGVCDATAGECRLRPSRQERSVRIDAKHRAEL